MSLKFNTFILLFFQAGGFVEFNRVNGNLALSRAFGDFAFKNNIELPQERQMISMKPDVVVHEVGEDLMFIVLACDGIWDVLGMDFLIDGQISSFCLRQHEAALLTLIISHKLTQSL